MLGELRLEEGERGGARRAELYGMGVLRAWADPDGWFGEGRVRRAGRALRRGGVGRVLAPADFDRWDLLEQAGLRPLDTGPFLRVQGPRLALGCLERQGLAPDRSTVALVGGRADRDMARAAAALCPKVRSLVISAPRGGRELALWLREEFGMAVLPRQAPAQVALNFCPGQEREEPALDLFGPVPRLGGLTLSAPALREEDRCSLPLLAALWEGGRLGAEGLKIT